MLINQAIHLQARSDQTNKREKCNITNFSTVG